MLEIHQAYHQGKDTDHIRSARLCKNKRLLKKCLSGDYFLSYLIRSKYLFKTMNIPPIARMARPLIGP